jgi:methionyl aminopeptidase
MAYPTSEPSGTPETHADDSRPLEPQDIINIDLTIFYQGYHGDTSRTYCLPDVDGQGVELVEATREALHIGLRACGPDMPLSGIGQAIE